MQYRIWDYGGPRSTELLNKKDAHILQNVVLEGMEVVKGSAPWSLTIRAGSLLINGQVTIEDADQVDVLSLDPPDATDRIDLVVAEHNWTPTSPPSTTTYRVLKGTPALAGQEPIPPVPNSDQVELARIRVRAGSSDLDPNDIWSAPKWRERHGELTWYKGLVLQGTKADRPDPKRYPGMVYYASDEGNTYISNGVDWLTLNRHSQAVVWTDPAPEADPTKDVRVGDLRSDTDQELLLMQTASGWQVVGTEWSKIRNRPTAFPPDAHPLSPSDPNAVHTGKIYIQRGDVADHNFLSHREEIIYAHMLMKPQEPLV